LSTFGSDRLGADDSQIGHGVGEDPDPSSCSSYWTGLSGRDPWRFDASAPSTGLFDTGGASLDGFLARFDGCGVADGYSWSLRMTPTQADAVVWGERAAALHCKDGVVTTTVVKGAPGGSIDWHMCSVGGDCEATESAVALSGDSAQHLVITELHGDGSLAWHGVFGPVGLDADAGAGTFAGRSHSDMAKDTGDGSYVVLTTTGPLSVRNVEPFAGCSEVLAPGAPAGTFMFHLQRGGFGEKAFCEWALRLGP
jgi:hypothetical protein